MSIITNIDQVGRTVAEYRQVGMSIVFTNGCFDIIHRGHVEYIERASEHGDILVIGLNSDDSVRRLKGKDRPFVSQEDRAYILSRLKPVDIVCIFEQDTPYELIKIVKPDVLIKGGDYTLDNIVGRDIAKKTTTIPLITGKSTTNIVDKIRSS